MQPREPSGVGAPDRPQPPSQVDDVGTTLVTRAAARPNQAPSIHHFQAGATAQLAMKCAIAGGGKVL